jgi:RNase P/RNase MRP subunit p29
MQVRRVMITLLACAGLFSALSTGAIAASPGPAVKAPPAIVHLSGTVQEVRAQSLLVKTDDGRLVVVRLNASTKYEVGNETVSARPTFHEGERVTIAGARIDDETVAARMVTVPAVPGPLTRHNGVVTEFSHQALTVRTDSGAVMVFKLTASTEYFVDNHRVAAQPSFHEGQPVGVMSRHLADGDRVAESVRTVDRDDHGIHMKGTILSVGPRFLTVRRANGKLGIVKLVEDTKYSVNGKVSEKHPTLRVGETIRVRAQRLDDETIVARTILIVDND